MADDPEALERELMARAHMRRQVKDAGVTQAALSRLWDQTVDPDDFVRTFEIFREKAVPLIQAGQSRSASVADDYYRDILRRGGYPVPRRLPPRIPASDAYVKGSLAAGAKFSDTAWKIRRGGNGRELAAKSKAAMLRSSKRQILNASRTRLLEHHKVDKNVRGWARVSDGKPCGFCAMLVSRGPVYSTATARFDAHDGCGCSARLVLRGEPGGGWDSESESYKVLWDELRNLKDFRYYVDNPYRAFDQFGITLPTHPRARMKPEPAQVIPAGPVKRGPLAGLPRMDPESYADATTLANVGEKIDRNYRTNCHYVVNAMELRARGYSVTARPTLKLEGRTTPQIAHDWRTASGETRPFSYPGRTGSSRASVAKLVAGETADWPVGARGYVTGAWKGRNRGAHIFNVEKTADGLVFHEGQIFTRTSEEAARYLADMKPQSVGILRVDDLEPAETILQGIQPLEIEDLKRIRDRRDNPDGPRMPWQDALDRDTARRRISANDEIVERARTEISETDSITTGAAEIGYRRAYLRAVIKAIEEDTVLMQQALAEIGD